MQRSRRTVLAAVPVALAGCARSFRDNTVPGGLHLRNRRNAAVTVSIRAALLPERADGGGGGGAGVTDSPTETPATPRDGDLDEPDVTDEYEVESGEDRAVPDFFPEAGRWAFEAVVESEEGEQGDRTRVELYTALPGPTGADTVVVRIGGQGVTAEATTID